MRKKKQKRFSCTSGLTEPYPQLESAVASLTAGPVGPGDMINGTDFALIPKYCIIVYSSREEIVFCAYFYVLGFTGFMLC